jgi:hypothetical protein
VTSPAASRDIQPTHHEAGADRDAGQCAGVAADEQFQRCAAAGDHGKVRILRSRPVAGLLLRAQHHLEPELPHAVVEQGLEKAWVLALQHHPQAGKESVALAQLAHTPALPRGEGLVCAALGWRAVPVEKCHAPSGGRKRQRREQPGYP